MSLNNKLYFSSISYDHNCRQVTYRGSFRGDQIFFLVKATNCDGIKSLAISDDFEIFLRPFLRDDPEILKRLIKITWVLIEGGELIFPIQI